MLDATLREKNIRRALDRSEAHQSLTPEQVRDLNELLWQAILPDLDWCEKVLKAYGIHGDYDAFHDLAETEQWTELREQIEKRPNNTDYCYALEYDDCFESDDCATIVTALRYRLIYLSDLQIVADLFVSAFIFHDERLLP